MPTEKPAGHRVHLHFAPDPIAFQLPSALSTIVRVGPSRIGAIYADMFAEAKIAEKAAELGAWVGAPTGDVTPVAGGFSQSYEACDIYYSEATGAHEVHGDIRLKYLALNGPAGVLGLPTTDESGTPDGIGRYNHFVGGSIYWTPHTGPMMVRGAIRDVWASEGWERGPLGYPVQDEYRMGTWSPATDPATYWSLFENGAILSSKDGCAPAVSAQIAPDVLRTVVRKTFDDAFHKPNSDGSGNDIGLQPQVDTLAISDWSYGFWKSGQRRITLRLHGFHDNGLAPDTNFTMDVQLAFDTFWQNSFTEPTTKTIAVGLYSVSVSASGLGAKAVADGVAHGVNDHFYPAGGADPAIPWVPWGWVAFTDVPTGADSHGSNIDVLGTFLATDGSLQVLLNPEPVPAGGGLRKYIAQQRIDALANP